MTITVPFGFRRSEVPPRCRKPRDVYYTGEQTVEVSEVTSAEAPVALRALTKDYGKDGTQAPVWQHKVDIRFWSGQLYCPCRRPHDFGSSLEKLQRLPDFAPGTRYIEEDTARGHILQSASNYILVDGEPWIKVDEPVYGINRYMAQISVSIGVEDSYKPNQPHWTQFRLDELDKAKEIARMLAGGNDARWSGPYTKYEVLMPQVLKAPAFTNRVRGRVTFEVEVEVEFGADMDSAIDAAFAKMKRTRSWQSLESRPKVEQHWGGDHWSELRTGPYGERTFAIR